MLLLLLLLYLLTLLRFLCWKVSPLVYSFIRVFVWFSLPQLHDETMRDYVEVMFDPKVVMLASDLTRSSATTNGFVCCFFLQTIFPPLAFYFSLSFKIRNSLIVFPYIFIEQSQHPPLISYFLANFLYLFPFLYLLLTSYKRKSRQSRGGEQQPNWTFCYIKRVFQ